MTEMSPLVRIRGVHKHFTRGSERINVLEGVDLDIPSGDFLALMGPSGSGKTTLLNLLGGLDTPTGGTIDVGGVATSDLGGSGLSRWRARNIGFVFQLYNLLPVLTAERNVELPLLLTKLSKAERRKRVAVALKAVGLSDRARHYPRQLSGGRNSASASRGPSSPTPRSCCATSQRAISTASPVTRFSTCCRRSIATTARPSSW